MIRNTVVIADSSEDFCRALQSRFCSFCNVKTCRSGREAVNLVTALHPDALVLDLLLPELDGISLLEAVNASGRCPAVLATTSYVSPYLLEAAGKLGVSVLMEKPCSMEKVGEALRRLLRRQYEQPETDLFSSVSAVLLHLGFSPKLRGYSYLRSAVMAVAEHPDLLIIKELYPGIARSYGVSPEDIEHSIRSVALDAWQRRVPGTWELYFEMSPGENPVRPANSALILGLARSLERKKDCFRAEINC